MDNKKILQDKIFSLVEEYYKIEHLQGEFIPGETPVPVSGRVYDASDIKSLVASALDFWLTAGRYNDEFQINLSEYLGIKHLITVNSGSSANLVAFSALTSPKLGERALRPDDEVITTATGFPTTINPALLHGAVPVFIDVNIPTYNIDADQIEEAISNRTKAIIIAHTLGNPFDINKITKIAKKYNLFLIEDACDALGSTYNKKMVGTYGDIGTLSFYPAHHITMGEGGAVFTNSAKLKRIITSIRDWGRDCYCEPGFDNTCKRRFEWKLGSLPKGYDHKYIYSHIGYNLKITDMQAAVGVAQLKHLDKFIIERRRNFMLLKHGLKHLEEFMILPEATEHSEPSWFGFPITIRENSPLTRDQLLIKLNEKKIGTRLIFGGNLAHQPYMKGRKFKIIGDLENSNKVMNNSFWIGVYPGLSPNAIEYVINTITDLLCKNGKTVA